MEGEQRETEPVIAVANPGQACKCLDKIDDRIPLWFKILTTIVGFSGGVFGFLIFSLYYGNLHAGKCKLKTSF